MYYTYLLRCRDDSLYCGYTSSIEKRLKAHMSGKGARYTRSHIPERIVYFEIHNTRSEAMMRECEIKKLTKEQKEALISPERKHG